MSPSAEATDPPRAPAERATGRPPDTERQRLLRRLRADAQRTAAAIVAVRDRSRVVIDALARQAALLLSPLWQLRAELGHLQRGGRG